MSIVEEDELIYRVFQSQSNSSHQGDWVRQIESDRKEIELNLDNSEISKMSKNKFKNVVHKKVENLALYELNKLKIKHSKSSYLNSNSFKMSAYLNDSRFSTRETQVLFSLRSQTLNVRKNFGNRFSDTLCEVCHLFPETQAHLLQCPVITPKLKMVSVGSELNVESVYGSVDEQLKIAKVYCKILEIRKEILREAEE